MEWGKNITNFTALFSHFSNILSVQTNKQLEDWSALECWMYLSSVLSLLTKHGASTEVFKSYSTSTNGRPANCSKALCTYWIKVFLQYCYLAFSWAIWCWNSHWIDNRLRAAESRYCSWLDSLMAYLVSDKHLMYFRPDPKYSTHIMVLWWLPGKNLVQLLMQCIWKSANALRNVFGNLPWERWQGTWPLETGFLCLLH